MVWAHFKNKLGENSKEGFKQESERKITKMGIKIKTTRG
jgi:hypothetical protein